MGHDHSHDHSVALVNVTQPNPVPPRFGVHVANGGLDVSVVARRATHVDFCVLDLDDSETRYALIPSNEGIWHGHINGLGVGTRYGFRADGPWDPDRGFFYNPAKFLLDPYGRGLEGSVDMSAAVYGHIVDENLYPTSYPFARSPLDSRGHVPC
ncbi:MAG: glycogen debranching enzyme, partial [Actinomycetaceae bacterium UMB1218B]|nr:glycogen debranching enzyme [Actinomycetaceae bacterium UMB1218B]